MLFISLPPFASELLSALIAAIAVLVLVRHRRPVKAHDWKREYAAIASRVRLKANHPWTYRVRQWTRGE